MELVGVIAVIAIAVLLNGLIARVEDDSPGGINNPDGSWLETFRKPRLHQIVIWALGFSVAGWLIYMFATK